jgi:hypothetical protein
MERGSDKHGPALDDQMKHEVEGTVRGQRGSHAEDWREPEPSGEDQPDVDAAPNASLTGGTPQGMTPDDVELRSQLAAYLGKEVYPAGRDHLLAVLRERNAPDALVGMVARLPEGLEFTNVQEVAEHLGIGVEAHRF